MCSVQGMATVKTTQQLHVSLQPVAHLRLKGNDCCSWTSPVFGTLLTGQNNHENTGRHNLLFLNVAWSWFGHQMEEDSELSN